MSDHALVLTPATPLSAEQLASRMQSLRTYFGGGFTSTLAEPPIWRIVAEQIVVFEYWDEQAELLVATADGGVAAARWKTVLIEGEPRELPEIPADNPPAEVLLTRLFELDTQLVATRLRAPDPPAAAAGLEPSITHW